MVNQCLLEVFIRCEGAKERHEGGDGFGDMSPFGEVKANHDLICCF